MYTEKDRHQLLNQIVAFVKNNREFACLLQIGSGVDGFADIYSDIDLMAGCMDAASAESANCKLCDFFNINGAVYIDHRKWSASVYGISAYFENGLSVDLSFMPVADIPIRTDHWKLLWTTDADIQTALLKKTDNITNSVHVTEQQHHKFFFTLRKAEKEILRENYIYADIAINEARQMLLMIEAMIEKKKTHQFKAFHTLNQDFLCALQKTYPKERNRSQLIEAKDNLLSLYIRTIENNHLCKIDDSHFMIINRFH